MRDKLYSVPSSLRVQGDSKLTCNNLFCKQTELEDLLRRQHSVVPETLLRSLLAFREASEVVASTMPSQCHRFGTTRSRPWLDKCALFGIGDNDRQVRKHRFSEANVNFANQDL